MKNIWVRQAREEDSKNFTEWFVNMPSFNPELFHFPETYILCAFNPKILAYGVVNFGHGIQVLSRVVVNPAAGELEKAGASKEIVKSVITIGYLNNLADVFFMGDNAGTNRIAEHVFEKVPYEEYKHIFGSSDFPVYRLRLKDLECQA
jgi:hypothetical protein